MKSLPLSKVYGLLEPGPVVMVTTVRDGKTDIMTSSWHTMLDFEPPLVGCVISNRGLTFTNLLVSRECVINIPTVELAAQAVGCGNTSGLTVDKFKKFHLTPRPAGRVKPPLIGECYASLECQLVDARMATRYNFFVLEVVKAWIRDPREQPRTIHHLGWGRFMVAGETIKLRSRMR
jgi:flavin reductase (DIM6/NTAB) family NADH-FMN oxidoreductase RutF